MNAQHQSGEQPKSGPTPSFFKIQVALIALRCWWKVVVPVAIVLACGTGALIYFLHKPTYTSDAWLLIKEKQEVILRDLNNDSRRFIQNQMEIIRSPRLLGPLSEKPAILAAPEFKDEQDVTAALARRIKITQRGQSDIYRVSFTSESPEKAALIVKEVTDAYLTFQRKTVSEQDNRIIRLLEEQRAARYEEMNQLRENVRTLSVQITGVDPFRSQVKDEQEIKKLNPMASLQGDLIRLEVDQDVLAVHIKAEEELQKAEAVVISAEAVAKQVVSHPSYLSLTSKIDHSRQKEVEFQKTGKNLPNNPLYRQLQSELVDDTEALTQLKVRLSSELKQDLHQRVVMERGDRLSSMKRDFAIGEAKLKVLKEKFKQELGTAKQYAGDSLELEFRRAKLEQVTKIHDEISTRLLHITTEQRAPERVEIFKDAAIATAPDELIPWKTIGLGFIGVFILPFALAIGWEHLFRRITDRTQMESVNEITVIGEVTALPSRRRSATLIKRPPERDVLLFEESIDGLRTYLSLIEPLGRIRTLAVTSAVSREGKTSLATQLAVSIARATGEPTLLIDGDMRSPDIHTVFDVEIGPGLSDVLSNSCPLEEAIETDFSDKLHILTAGRLAVSPHRLLGSGEFGFLLEKASTMYRHIVIDTPPILPASEALVMSKAADVTLLCVRRDFSRVDQVQEAHRRMIAAGVRTAGAVINGIPIHYYAYKYGSYAYNRTLEAASAT